MDVNAVLLAISSQNAVNAFGMLNKYALFTRDLLLRPF